MSITDELREFKGHINAGLAPDMVLALRAEINCIADRIDAEHQEAENEWKAKSSQSWLHGYDECRAELMEGNEAIAACLEEAGWVQLPKDADGECIRVGDKLDGYETTLTVDELVLGKSGWAIVDSDGDRWSNSCAFSHSNEPTVEKVMQEMLEQAVGYSDARTTVALNAIAKYAAKLRLADDCEEQ